MGAIQQSINSAVGSIVGAAIASQVKTEKATAAKTQLAEKQAAADKAQAVTQKVDETLSGMGAYTKKAVAQNPEALKKMHQIAGEGYDLANKGYSQETLNLLQKGNETALRQVGKDVMKQNRQARAREKAIKSKEQARQAVIQQKQDREQVFLNGVPIGTVGDFSKVKGFKGGK